jgi:hypothetical protein
MTLFFWENIYSQEEVINLFRPSFFPNTRFVLNKMQLEEIQTASMKFDLIAFIVIDENRKIEVHKYRMTEEPKNRRTEK